MTTLGMRIAGVGFNLHSHRSLPPRFERYRAYFREPTRGGWDVEVGPDPVSSLARCTGRLLRREAAFEVEGLEARARLDIAGRRIETVMDPYLLIFDALVRAALQIDVLGRGGCLVHAAALLVKGLAHVFPGQSGSGKSTLATLAEHVLSDEVCVIAPAAAGFEVHGTPWWNGRGGSAPLAATYRLAWGSEGVASLSRTDALRHLATNLVLPIAEPAHEKKAFEAACRIATSVPFARFAFRPHSDVDALLSSRAARIA